jgi:dihydrolipoamide dehydrogenase
LTGRVRRRDPRRPAQVQDRRHRARTPGRLGGICLNWGCIPTKALLKNAEIYRQAFSTAPSLGITCREPQIRFRPHHQAQPWRRRSHVQWHRFPHEEEQDHARFRRGEVDLKGGKIEVTKKDGTKEVIEAKHIIIATGARARSSIPNVALDGEKRHHQQARR